MTPEEHRAILAKVLEQAKDQGEAASLLTQIADDYGTLVAAKSEKEIEAERLKKENETLRDTNMRLFLRVGMIPEKQEPEKTDPEQNLTYEALFDEKMRLK